MDYSEMNLGSWNSYLARFKDLLRPEGLSPLGAEGETAVEAARADGSAAVKLGVITTALPNLVFEGYYDWYGYQDEWVLRNLGHVLTTEEEHEILSRLDQNTPESLLEVLAYIADQRLPVWQTEAREEFAESLSENEPGVLTGVENTANWHASRTPGTYYYTYVDDRYLYSDLAEAPMSEWETLPVRERLAAENAQPWGDDGWYYTPTGEPGLYGGGYVYAADREGPWLTEETALAEAEALARERRLAQLRYHPVDLVTGYPGWALGYDTEAAEWKYARVTTAGVMPDDDAEWFAVNESNADGTEYFAGPGYSETGWLPYRQAQSEEATAPDPEQTPAETLEPAIQAVREGVVDPAVSRMTSELREKLPAEMVSRLGPGLERLAEHLVVEQAAKLLAAAGQPV